LFGGFVEDGLEHVDVAADPFAQLVHARFLAAPAAKRSEGRIEMRPRRPLMAAASTLSERMSIRSDATGSSNG
jgi:hypothetical protein